jgi:hypothetical protein
MIYNDLCTATSQSFIPKQPVKHPVTSSRCSSRREEDPNFNLEPHGASERSTACPGPQRVDSEQRAAGDLGRVVAIIVAASRNVPRSVNWQLHRSRNLHCHHEPPWSSPSPPLEERDGGEEAIWNLELGSSLVIGAWDLELSPAGSWKGSNRVWPIAAAEN